MIDEYDSEEDLYQSCENLDDYLENNCSMDSLALKNLANIPSGLSTEACFNYSLAFILFPIIGFAMEWYSDYKGMLKKEVNIHYFLNICIYMYGTIYPLTLDLKCAKMLILYAGCQDLE